MSNQNTKQKFLSIYNGNSDYIADENIRGKSVNFFRNSRFPTLKDEPWRHTDISPVLEPQYQQPRSEEISKTEIIKYLISGLEANILVFVNGYYKPALSKIISPENTLQVKNLARAKYDNPEIFKKYFESTRVHQKSIFTALNTSVTTDGTFVYIPKGKLNEYPVHILNIAHSRGNNMLIHPRNLIVADEGSHAKIIETYHSLSEGINFTNVATEIIVNSNAMIDYHILQSENDTNYQINHLNVDQYEGSRFSSHTFTFCGGLIRNDIHVNQRGEYCETNLNGLYLSDKHQHFDNYTYINHEKPNGTSREMYRGIMDNESSAVFFGKVYVASDAQKTIAEQANKNVLLSDNATVNSKPQLEIYADDVNCSHGSTTGQLDKEELFYLMSRGISRQKAKSLLLYAFTSDLIHRLTIERFKNKIDWLLTKRLSGEKLDNHCTRLLERQEAE